MKVTCRLRASGIGRIEIFLRCTGTRGLSAAAGSSPSMWAAGCGWVAAALRTSLLRRSGNRTVRDVGNDVGNDVTDVGSDRTVAQLCNVANSTVGASDAAVL